MLKKTLERSAELMDTRAGFVRQKKMKKMPPFVKQKGASISPFLLNEPNTVQ
jgi:hypothetical protein